MLITNKIIGKTAFSSATLIHEPILLFLKSYEVSKSARIHIPKHLRRPGWEKAIPKREDSHKNA